MFVILKRIANQKIFNSLKFLACLFSKLIFQKHHRKSLFNGTYRNTFETIQYLYCFLKDVLSTEYSFLHQKQVGKRKELLDALS